MPLLLSVHLFVFFAEYSDDDYDDDDDYHYDNNNNNNNVFSRVTFVYANYTPAAAIDSEANPLWSDASQAVEFVSSRVFLLIPIPQLRLELKVFYRYHYKLSSATFTFFEWAAIQVNGHLWKMAPEQLSRKPSKTYRCWYWKIDGWLERQVRGAKFGSRKHFRLGSMSLIQQQKPLILE